VLIAPVDLPLHAGIPLLTDTRVVAEPRVPRVSHQPGA
jgi:hypothetical protein